MEGDGFEPSVPRGESAAVDEPYTIQWQARSGTPTVYGHAKPSSLDVTVTQQDAPSPGDGRSAGGFRAPSMWEVVGASVSRGKVFGRRALRADRGDPLPVTDVAKDEGSGIEAMFAHDPVSLTQRTTGPIVASDRLVPTVRTMTSATLRITV